MIGRPKGSKRKKHIYKIQQLKFLEEKTKEYSLNELVILFNKKFDVNLSKTTIASTLKRNDFKSGRTGRFEKGNMPFNKGTKGICKANITSFKKGNIPHQYKPIGSTVIDVDGYTKVKIGDPNKWIYKHRMIFEDINGPISKGKVLIFTDGNKDNFDIN